MASCLQRRVRKPVHLEGYAHPDFKTVETVLRRQLKDNPGGAAVCVYHHGERVVDLWGGFRDDEGRLWRKDTMAPSFSTTKGVASTLLHILADRGLIDYDARVADYWPEFAQAGKAEITIRQVMSHQSGLYHIRQMIDHADRMLDWEHMVQAIEQTPPAHEPGKRTGYHGLTYGFIIGEVIQRVTGKTAAQNIRQRFLEPRRFQEQIGDVRLDLEEDRASGPAATARACASRASTRFARHSTRTRSSSTLASRCG